MAKRKRNKKYQSIEKAKKHRLVGFQIKPKQNEKKRFETVVKRKRNTNKKRYETKSNAWGDFKSKSENEKIKNIKTIAKSILI